MPISSNAASKAETSDLGYRFPFLIFARTAGSIRSSFKASSNCLVNTPAKIPEAYTVSSCEPNAVMRVKS